MKTTLGGGSAARITGAENAAIAIAARDDRRIELPPTSLENDLSPFLLNPLPDPVDRRIEFRRGLRALPSRYGFAAEPMTRIESSAIRRTIGSGSRSLVDWQIGRGPGDRLTLVSAAVSRPSLNESLALISPLLPPVGSTGASPLAMRVLPDVEPGPGLHAKLVEPVLVDLRRGPQPGLDRFIRVGGRLHNRAFDLKNISSPLRSVIGAGLPSFAFGIATTFDDLSGSGTIAPPGTAGRAPRKECDRGRLERCHPRSRR